MDQSNIRSITNDYQDVRLVSLKTWERAIEVSLRDNDGPYVVLQEGYDPQDLKMSYDEFLLGKSGEWVSVSVFYRLPDDMRVQEFIFATAAEVIGLMEKLTGKAEVYCKDHSLLPQERDAPDDLSQIFRKAKARRLRRQTEIRRSTH
jgi:hypothetical protein